MPSSISSKKRKTNSYFSHIHRDINSLNKKTKTGNTLKVIGIIISIAIFFAGLYFGGTWVINTIAVTRDTISIPGSFTIESTSAEEKPLSEAYLNFRISGTGVMFGGCADLPGCIGSSDGEYYSGVCRANGFKDRGCGWNDETSCSCTSCQTGCWGETPYFPSNIKISCNTQVIPYNCDTNGNCRTQNFASIFPQSIPQDWSMECIVTCDSRGKLTNTILEYRSGKLCIPIYDECQPWSSCIGGKQTRKCYQSTDCKVDKEFITQEKECNAGTCADSDYGWGKVAGTCYYFDKCSTPSTSIKIYSTQNECEKSNTLAIILSSIVLLGIIIGGAFIYAKKKKSNT